MKHREEGNCRSSANVLVTLLQDTEIPHRQVIIIIDFKPIRIVVQKYHRSLSTYCGGRIENDLKSFQTVDFPGDVT